MKFIPYDFPKTEDSKYIIMQQDLQILFSRREELGLTQQEVADIAHMTLRQYQRLESGERSLSSCSMRIGLSVCAALLLDPYEILGIDINQPNKKIVPFKTHPGRKGQMHNDLFLYFGHERYSVIIPMNVVKALGNPEHIQLLYNKSKKSVAIRIAGKKSKDAYSIPMTAKNERQTHNETAKVAIYSPEFAASLRVNMKCQKGTYKTPIQVVKDKDNRLAVVADLNDAIKEKIAGPYIVAK